MAKKSSRKGLILVLALAIVLRLIGINQSFWLDEASQAQMSSLSVSQIWSGRSADFHPPLFYLLARVWLQFGQSETWLRTLPVLFGILNVYILYLLAGRMFAGSKLTFFGREVSLSALSGLFLAISPFHVYYSQEFRSYSLLGLLGTWSMYLLFTRQYFWLSIANALLLYTHYSSAFLIAAQLAFVIFYSRTDLKKYLLSLSISFLLFVPWLPQFTAQLQSGGNIDSYLPGWRDVLSVSMIKILPLTFFKLTAGRISFLSSWVYLPYIIFVLGCVFAAFRLTGVKRNFLFNWILVPLFTMIAVSFLFPQNQPFRVIFILPGLILIFVQACARFPRLFLTLFLYIFVVGNISYFTRPRLQREQWRQAVEFLQENKYPYTEVVVKFSDRFSPFYWYSPDLPVVSAVPHYPARPEEVTGKLGFLQSGETRRVYLLDYLGELTDPKREVDLALTNLGFLKVRTENFEGVGFIHVYNR